MFHSGISALFFTTFSNTGCNGNGYSVRYQKSDDAWTMPFY